jgi:hypothetical protein
MRNWKSGSNHSFIVPLILGLLGAGCATEPSAGDEHVSVVTSAFSEGGQERGWIDSFDYGFESALPSTWVPSDANVRGWACPDPAVADPVTIVVSELAVYVGGPPGTGTVADSVALNTQSRSDLNGICGNPDTSGFFLGFNWPNNVPRGAFYVTYTSRFTGQTLLLGGAHH